MFECTIELLHPSRQRDAIPSLWVVNRHNFDPGIKEGETLEINDWRVDGKPYTFDVTVVKRKWEIHPPDQKLASQHGYPEETIKNGLLILRIFVEAEDREKLIEITEAIKKLNPE